jgi:hypothetical protein
MKLITAVKSFKVQTQKAEQKCFGTIDKNKEKSFSIYPLKQEIPQIIFAIY